jgi:spermidine synthase
LPLSNLICFGSQNRHSRPFSELQGDRQLVALVFEEAEKVHDQQTAFQHIQVYKHPYFGHILSIDGSLQITERDEAIYHEMMVHVPMAYLVGKTSAAPPSGAPGVVAAAAPSKGLRIILVGGGDGGANTQLFKYAGIESVFHIDIDMKAMRDVTQSYFQHLYASFLDRRLQTFSYDGSQWVKERVDDASQVGSFDLIIIDSTDYGSAETLFTDEFYLQLRSLLKADDRSIMLLNLDSPQWNLEVVATVQQQLARMFKYSFVYVSSQPTFLSGAYSYLFVSDTVHPMTTEIDWAKWSTAGSGQQGVHTRYYTPGVHYASFMLPADLSRKVSMAGQFKDVRSVNAKAPKILVEQPASRSAATFAAGEDGDESETSDI